jgi:acetyl-CoA C-acetyltransferase
MQNGQIGPEIVPVEVKGRKATQSVSMDEEYTKVDFNRMKDLKTVFQKGYFYL